MDPSAHKIQPFVVKRTHKDEKFGFSLKKKTDEETGEKVLIIKKIMDDSPGQDAGLTEGMVVVEINNVPLMRGSTVKDASRAIDLTPEDEPMTIAVRLKISECRKSLPRVSAVIPPVPKETKAPKTVPKEKEAHEEKDAPKEKDNPKPAPRKKNSDKSASKEKKSVEPPNQVEPSKRPTSEFVPRSSRPSIPPKPRHSVAVTPPAIPRSSQSVATPSAEEVVILDTGAWMTKIGLVSSSSPAVFPTVVGRHKMAGFGQPSPFGGPPAQYGRAAMSKKSLLKLTFPLEQEIITNWEDMKAFWKYAFNDELRSEAKGKSVIFTESLFANKDQRERITEIMFKDLQISALNIVPSTLLAMYAAGRANDTLIVDVGHRFTQVLPVCHDHNGAFFAATKYRLGGQDVSDRLAQLVSSETGHTFTATDHNLNQIKTEFGAVAPNSESAYKDCAKETFTLPDGTAIPIGSERYQCTEVLFDPARFGLGMTKSIQEAVVDAVVRCKSEAKVLLQNIVITGGSSSFPGFAERLENEVKQLAPGVLGEKITVKVLAKHNGELGAWNGAAVIFKSGGMKNQWISQEEYISKGPSVVHQKSAPL